MNFDNQIESDDDEWFEGLESDEDNIEMGSAVQINDPISTLGLKAPLMVEIGTNMKNALDLLQGKEQNCILIVENNVLKGILTERDILLKITGKGFDLELVIVDEFMSENPEYLNPEDPLAYALNKMHVGGFRHVPIVNDSLKPELIVETDDFGNFEFNYLEPNNYVISALEAKIYNFNKQLRINRYGIISDDYLSLKNKDEIKNVEIYMDNPLEKIYIESIDIKNYSFGVLNFSNGSKENFLIPFKDKLNKIQYNIGDTILINLQKENHLEKYSTKDFKFILPEVIDTIPPKIISQKLLNEKINIEFSEPLKNINNLKEVDDSSDLKILGYTDKDSIRMEYTFLDPFTLSITNDVSINYIKLFQDNIKDISNNILLDSITTISINDLTKIENTSLDNSKTGSIIGTVNYSGDVPIIINAKNIENNLNFFTMVQNDKYKFNFLPSGKYILWGYESLNVLDSTRYFSGIWNPYQRSSKFIIYSDTIDVRARWTIDELNMDFK